jgi:hypothetical protein
MAKAVNIRFSGVENDGPPGAGKILLARALPHILPNFPLCSKRKPARKSLIPKEL